jgi:hypothetical protein|tara:strand:+ start:76 stop:288 length:213 start_codon:yes stop_codon:yes gene_type:complete
MPERKKNPVAKEVRTPKYKQRIVKDKNIYDRKKLLKDYAQADEEEDDRMRFADHLCEIAAVEKLKNKTKQ